MELHSYAKRRTLKKWTIEQKRKLVETRIAYDDWFTNKPTSVVPWKNILVAANLDDFNVFFVRKQWSNMLARYKLYKQTRFGIFSTEAIDIESIRRINQEWEFFEPIHNFMTRKTTNLHSYALTHRTDDSNNNNNDDDDQQQQQGDLVQSSNTEEQIQTKLQNEKDIINLQQYFAKENIPNNATIVLQSTINSNKISNDDGIYIFSSDTNEEFQQLTTSETIRMMNEAIVEDDDDEHINFVRNTDHDFYSKRSSQSAQPHTITSEVKITKEELQEEQNNYFADASEESQGSTGIITDKKPNATNSGFSNLAPINTLTVGGGSEKLSKTDTVCRKELNDEMPSTSTQRNITHFNENTPTSSTSRLTERDKYYRHRRRFNRRMEKRFDALLHVIGQIVKDEFPSVDVTPLVGTVTHVASTVGQVFTSESEGETSKDDHSEDNNHSDVTDNIPSTTNNMRDI